MAGAGDNMELELHESAGADSSSSSPFPEGSAVLIRVTDAGKGEGNFQNKTRAYPVMGPGGVSAELLTLSTSVESAKSPAKAKARCLAQKVQYHP